MWYNTNMNASEPKYELLSVDENGNEVRRYYKDGSLRNQKGHALEKLPNAGHEITSENARYYHELRKQKILRAIEERVMDVTKTNAPADAIGRIVAKRAEIAMNDDSKTGNDAAKIVLNAIDAYQEKVQSVSVTRNEYAMDADTLEILRAMMEARAESTRADDYTQEESNDNE